MNVFLNVLFLIGRIIFGLYWLNNAYRHLVSRRTDMVQYSAYKKVPAPTAAVVGTGILLLIGGLSILTGFWPCIGLAAIALFLIGVTPKMHDYWKETEPMSRMNAHINFAKNLGLLGATLMMFVIATPWPWSL